MFLRPWSNSPHTCVTLMSLAMTQLLKARVLVHKSEAVQHGNGSRDVSSVHSLRVIGHHPYNNKIDAIL